MSWENGIILLVLFSLLTVVGLAARSEYRDDEYPPDDRYPPDDE